MKFGNSVLVEIVEIVRCGITQGEDISELLRKVDVTLGSNPETGVRAVLELSNEYLRENGRTH